MRAPGRILRAGAMALAIAMAPVAASACPVCFDAREQARIAYLATTGILSLLPLAFVGGVVLYVRSRVVAAGRLDEIAAGGPSARDEDPRGR